MLAIRMQRTGRTGHAQYRIIVQEARRTPTSGAIVALLGHYNPHTKAVVVAKDKASFYMEHGAQPTDRVARILQKEGLKLPSWVQLNGEKKSVIRHPEKLRRNRPAEPKPEVVAETPVAPAETAADQTKPEEAVSNPVEEVAEPTPKTTAETEPAEAAESEDEPVAEPEATEEKTA